MKPSPTARIKGRAIYQPAGAAEEYSKWACNLYKGCDHNCSYCYCKHGPLAHALGGPSAILKASLTDEHRAFDIFCHELDRHREQIINDGGLFFSFSSDPFLPQTTDLTARCIIHALEHQVPVSVLTKATDWFRQDWIAGAFFAHRDILRIGFTLTGHDELEPGAPTNKERIRLIQTLHGFQFYTFASIEPVIDFKASLNCILDIAPYIDDLRIGLLSPYSPSRYNWQKADDFKATVDEQARIHGFSVLYKASFLRFYREAMPPASAAPSPDECPAVSPQGEKVAVPAPPACPPFSSPVSSPAIASPVPAPLPPDPEAAFRARIRADVQERLAKFSRKENISIAYAPLVITELIWHYAFETINKAALYRVSEVKKLSRVVRMLHEKQRDLYRKDLKPQHIYNIEQQTKHFHESITTLLTQLWFCVNNEVRRVAPELPYHDLRTDAFVAVILLDWHKAHNKRMDALIAERMGSSSGKYETPIHDALRDAMAAYVAPANPSFNIHIETAMRVLENKINTTDFQPFSE